MIKKYGIGLLAVIMAFSTAAFTNAKSSRLKPTFADSWIPKNNAVLDDFGEATTESNYEKDTHSGTCEEGEKICAIFANERMDGGLPSGEPDITPTLESEISDALDDGESSPNVLIRPL
jgi:hypothetical protein